MAYASFQIVSVDGRAVEFQMYALKNAAGNLTNYVKIRDLASILNGTAAQFSVDWDGQVLLTKGQPYLSNGSERKTPFSGDRAYTQSTSQTNVGGKLLDLDAIVLQDDTGGGYTYYQLRDLGRALDFYVGWDSVQAQIYIETTESYGEPYGAANGI